MLNIVCNLVMIKAQEVFLYDSNLIHLIVKYYCFNNIMQLNKLE